MLIVYFPVIVSLFTITLAFFLIFKIIKIPLVKNNTVKVAVLMYEGLVSYLKNRYKIASIMVPVLFFVLFVALGWRAAFGFFIGAVVSGLLGCIGVLISVQADVKIAQILRPRRNSLGEAAKKGVVQISDILFNASLAAGFLGASFGLLAVSGYYFLTGISGLVALVFGTSLVCFLGQITREVESKMHGNVAIAAEEKKIPENKSGGKRIAANKIKGHFGDLADLTVIFFETYSLAVVAMMMLGILWYPKSPQFTLLPLFLASVLLLTSIITSFFIGILKNKNSMTASYVWLVSAIFLPALAFYPVIINIMSDQIVSATNIYFSCLAGFLITAAIFLTGKYFNFKIGIRVAGMVTLLVLGGSVSSFLLVGMYGVALTALSMLSILGTPFVVYFSDQVKEKVASISKIHMMIFKGLMAVVLWLIYLQQIANISGMPVNVMVFDARVIAGLVVGGFLPCVFLVFLTKIIKKNTAMGLMQRMLILISISIIIPILTGFILGADALGGLLAGVIFTGLCLSILMTMGTDILANIKRYLEVRGLGGRRMFARQIVMVMDNYKETTVLALESMVNIIGLVALLVVVFLI